MIHSTVDYALIGKRIKAKRTELHITQEQMASDLNLSTFYISKIENGKCTPTLDTLSVLANYPRFRHLLKNKKAETLVI